MLKEQASPFPYLAKQARKQTPQKSRGQYNSFPSAAVSWLTASFRVLYDRMKSTVRFRKNRLSKVLFIRRVFYSKKKAPRTFANQQRFAALTADLTANSHRNTLHIYSILKQDKRIAPFSH